MWWIFMHWIKKLQLFLILLGFWACSVEDTDFSGSTLETENSIALLAVSSDGFPVENAAVILRHSDFIKTRQNDYPEEIPETNEEGLLLLDTLSPGNYIAEVRAKYDGSELKGALSFEINSLDLDSSVVFSVEIDQAEDFQGTISADPENAWVMIRGLDYAVPVDSLGNYSFPSLPAGEFEFVLVYLDSTEDYQIKASATQCIGCNTSSIPLVDSLYVPPVDSQEILEPDSNVTDTIPQDTLKHFMFEDFEAGTESWYSSFSQYASGSLESVEAGDEREGLVAHFTCVNDSAYNWALMGKSLKGAVDMSELDSVVFWAKGEMKNYISFSFDIVDGKNPDMSSGKSWVHIELDSEWKRYTVTPDILLPNDSIGGNIGWHNVKTEITNISIFGGSGGEFWIDDIEVFGYDSFVVKEE